MMTLALIGIGSVMGLAGAVLLIWVLIRAFKQETKQGVLCLFVPGYLLYFGFAKLRHPKAALLTGIALVLVILGAALNVFSSNLSGESYSPSDTGFDEGGLESP